MQGGLVMAKRGRLELGDNIYGYFISLYATNVTYLASKSIEFGGKKRKRPRPTLLYNQYHTRLSRKLLQYSINLRQSHSNFEVIDASNKNRLAH